RLSNQWRVICPDLRGRGDSDYARDPMTYSPAQYFDDLEALLEDQAITRFVAIGTSLGGLLTMMLAARAPERVAAAVLNDIGPEIDPAGLARIREYVGQGRSHETWVHAARALQDTFREAYPRYGLPDWLRMAKRVMVIGTGGRIVFDYDMNIAVPFEAAENAVPAPDMWPMFDALAGRPVLVLRGGLSDILSADTAARMAARGPDIELVTLSDVGHAPTLDEPESIAAIDGLLARVS
ncbi:alpha/beta hydrolase, partial [Novosphingobium sp. Chol11]|uniref:alpha/beta fold hydrolase n=1 Tax=Novosphingobium sp. Chol11 TaxID=1385763 RepID=UPI0025D08119